VSASDKDMHSQLKHLHPVQGNAGGWARSVIH
jgi:hypothetical protein